MTTWKSIATTIVLVGSLSLSGIAVAQSSKQDDKSASNSRAINSYTCKDVMRASGEDRVISLALLHGYFLGKSGATTIDADAMRKATDEFIEYCLDHPTAKALEAMGKFVQ